ncbi:MAG: ABC transporter substrate-binding protein [Armatimonadota bacterium]
MRRYAILLIPALLAGGFFLRQGRTSHTTHVAGGGYPLTVTDARGCRVSIPARPERIISLSPAVTEVLFAIGAGGRVIADTNYCDYPAEAAKLPKVGGYFDPNAEKIVSLSPDLVIGQASACRSTLDHLASLGIGVIAVEPKDLQGVSDTVRLIGRAVGADGEALASSLDARRRAVNERAKRHKDRPKVLFLFDTESLFTAGGGSYIGDLIRRAGGENIAADIRSPWPEISMEKVVAENPEVIVIGGRHGSLEIENVSRLTSDPRWRSVAAVKNRRIYVLNDDTLSLPGPRLIEGLEAMEKIFGGKR